ncbi:MAG: peptidase T [Lentisphaeria bacterium]|nr:peptidase T [Lentisphaeria bacterium]
MKSVLERFLTYVSFDTRSEESSPSHPSAEKEFRLAEVLREELRELGLGSVTLTDKCYVYAKVPASPGCEKAPALGFIAHLDTAGEASGAGVKPQIIENWDGSPIPLGTSGILLSPKAALKGHTLVTTDGTTLLGADDKAGIAAIMTAVAELLDRKLPHGPLCIAFTPDEEIGAGADFFDLDLFGAAFAYTVDGGAPEVIESENFNAARAVVKFKGLSVHPGSAKGVMINAQRVAMEFDALLPAHEVPEETAMRQGFHHLTGSSGSVSKAEFRYILRDHDRGLFEARKEQFRKAAEAIDGKYGPGTATLEITDQYRNMAEVIEKYPFLISRAEEAIRKAGLEPLRKPIRGGTDGARLSFMGLPCPNLGYGGYNAHGEREYADVQGMEQVVKILLNLAESFGTAPERQV